MIFAIGMLQGYETNNCLKGQPMKKKCFIFFKYGLDEKKDVEQYFAPKILKKGEKSNE